MTRTAKQKTKWRWRRSRRRRRRRRSNGLLSIKVSLFSNPIWMTNRFDWSTSETFVIRFLCYSALSLVLSLVLFSFFLLFPFSLILAGYFSRFSFSRIFFWIDRTYCISIIVSINHMFEWEQWLSPTNLQLVPRMLILQQFSFSLIASICKCYYISHLSKDRTKENLSCFFSFSLSDIHLHRRDKALKVSIKWWEREIH